VTSSLWEAALGAWYGPATPLVQRFRTYRPNRRGRIVLRRWLRVVLLRAMATGFASAALLVAFHVVGVAPRHPRDAAFPPAILLFFAALLWRCSLIRLVLRPGEIVRYSVFRHAVVPCVIVQRMYRPEGRGNSLTLETYGGQRVNLYWFDGSLWDALFDFSRVCEDALRAHVRASACARPEQQQSRFEWRFTWSLVAETLSAATVVFVLFGVTLLSH
jgi:hypothetical protein